MADTLPQIRHIEKFVTVAFAFAQIWYVGALWSCRGRGVIEIGMP